MPKIRHDKRDREITIRVNEEELEQLKQRQQGKTLANWLRNLGLGVTPIRQADPQLVRALGRIGSNLNQLTKLANTNRQLDQQLIDDINVIRQLMSQLIDRNLEKDK